MLQALVTLAYVFLLSTFELPSNKFEGLMVHRAHIIKQATLLHDVLYQCFVDINEIISCQRDIYTCSKHLYSYCFPTCKPVYVRNDQNVRTFLVNVVYVHSRVHVYMCM